MEKEIKPGFRLISLKRFKTKSPGEELPGLFTMKTKASYQRMLHTYKTRKVIAKREGRPVMGLTVKINNLQRSVNTLQKGEEEITKIAGLVKEFTNFELWKSIGDRSRKGILAKGLFCKFVIERGIGRRQSTAIWYLGTPYVSVPSRIRKCFQQSFKTHPENLILWKKFSQFMSENYDTRKVEVLNTRLPYRGEGEREEKGRILDPG